MAGRRRRSSVAGRGGREERSRAEGPTRWLQGAEEQDGTGAVASAHARERERRQWSRGRLDPAEGRWALLPALLMSAEKGRRGGVAALAQDLQGRRGAEGEERRRKICRSGGAGPTGGLRGRGAGRGERGGRGNGEQGERGARRKKDMGRGGAEQGDSSQYGGGALGIVIESAVGRRIPFGIEANFQYQFLKHPNSWYSVLPMPIPNSRLQCLHPNRA